MNLKTVMMVVSLMSAGPVLAQGEPEKDVFKTPAGDLEITFIGHGTLMMAFGGKIIHVDPCGALADYGKLPKADVILVTHEHPDHLDAAAIGKIRTTNTTVLVSTSCTGKVSGAMPMKNGKSWFVKGIRVDAVPAYNIVHMRDKDHPYHPKGPGNGYVLTFGDKRVYVAGDTENTPELKALKGIDIAFLPMNLPYTMTPEMAADAALALRPAVLYPYHFGETDPAKLKELLKDAPDIEVRIRPMK